MTSPPAAHGPKTLNCCRPSALSAVSGRQIAAMVDQLAQAEISLTSLSCVDDSGPVCLFAFQQIVDGLAEGGYAWAEREG